MYQRCESENCPLSCFTALFILSPSYHFRKKSNYLREKSQNLHKEIQKSQMYQRYERANCPLNSFTALLISSPSYHFRKKSENILGEKKKLQKQNLKISGKSPKTCRKKSKKSHMYQRCESANCPLSCFTALLSSFLLISSPSYLFMRKKEIFQGGIPKLTERNPKKADVSKV